MEGGLRGDVVDKNGAGRTTVVGPRHGPEAFGSCCVPELGELGDVMSGCGGGW